MENFLVRIFAAVFYVAMVVVNFLANGLPINNRSTGEISDAYFNLFAPAGITFSIWGLIYLLLGGYVIYQFKKNTQERDVLLKKTNFLFIATSLANILWILSWHYDYIGLSVVLMLALLTLLIQIANLLRSEQFTSGEKLFIKTPFSVYFGWITVATIANVTVFLVSVGWKGFGIVDFIWTSVILFVGALIGIARLHKDKNIAYGLVLIWAYLGILFKHISSSGFDGKYPSVIVTASLCVILFVFFVGRIIFKK